MKFIIAMLFLLLLVTQGCDTRDLNIEIQSCMISPDTLFINSDNDIYDVNSNIILNIIDTTNNLSIEGHLVEYNIQQGFINMYVYTDSLGIAKNKYYPLCPNFGDSLVSLPIIIRAGNSEIIKYVTLKFNY
jgi:hypothetical protein